MTTRPKALLLALGLLAGAVPVSAQVRISGAIAGTVLDSSNLVVPGAIVQLKDELTGLQKTATTNESGAFAFPDLNFGTYQVTISLQGFRTVTYSNVVVQASRTTDLRIKLELGQVGEAVTVIGAAPVLEVTTNTISNTLSNQTLRELPLAGRNTFGFARLLPGVTQPANTGSTHFNGMPGGTINPTIDGINNSSNGFKSGGTSFFGTVPARLGAIEEVTVESAGLSADAAQSGVNLKFITRRGTNQYHGTGFEQLRNEALNSNSFFNRARGIPKARLRRHDYGGNLGGPLLPASKLRDKIFFFVNYEQEYIPGTAIQTNTLLSSEAERGIFRYQTTTGEQRTANLLQIAAQNGFPSAIDPTISGLLARQRQASAQGDLRSTNNLRTQSLAWLEPSKQINVYPTARLDYQITPNLSWMGSWNLYSQDNQGRRQWPLPETPIQFMFHASWWITSTGMNWTLGPGTHNDFRYGVQHSGDTTPNRGAEFYRANGLVNAQLARFSFPAPFNGIPNMVQDAAPITGRHYITTIFDTVTLLRGNHSIKIGGAYRLTEWRDTSLDAPGSAGILGFPRYTLGSPAGDPVQSIFNVTSMPGIQTADLADVYALYAMLTGRLARVQTGRVADPATGQFSDAIYRENWTSSKMGGIYAQDSWRLKPNLTLNYGLRWEFSGAPYNHTGVAMFPDYANLLGPSTALFQPGTLNGVANPVITRGQVAAKADLVNPAPNFGFTWTPSFERGLLAKLIGNAQRSVIRGGYVLTYYDEGTNMFASTAGNNPGQAQSLDLRPGLPGFVPGQLTLQTPLPPFAVFPLTYANTYAQSTFTFGSGISTMKDDLRTPYVQAWNIGIQRELLKNTVLEVRYMGNKASKVWRTYNLNEANIFENGFLEEFRNAQQNLAINQAAGVNSFENRGLPGQRPLPIFEAAFGTRGSQAALPGASGFTNGGFITSLQQGTAGALAGNLAFNSTYFCRMVGSTFGPCQALGFDAAGRYPINFFVVNPFGIGGNLNLVDDSGYSNYHALQLQLRRRYAGGVTMDVNYTLAENIGNIWADNATQTVNYRTLRDRELDRRPTPFDLRHVLQTFGTYELPFGEGRRFSSRHGAVNAIAGGWTVGGILTFQTGSPFRLSSGRSTHNAAPPQSAVQDGGVVLMNGLTVKELQKMIKISPGPGFNKYWIDPRLIGPDGRANPQYLGVPTTPGEFGQFVFLRTPKSWNVDASISKQARIVGAATLVVHLTATNVLNRPMWGIGPAVSGVGLNFLQDANITSTTFGQSVQPINGTRQLYVRAELRF